MDTTLAVAIVTAFAAMFGSAMTAYAVIRRGDLERENDRLAKDNEKLQSRLDYYQNQKASDEK